MNWSGYSTSTLLLLFACGAALIATLYRRAEPRKHLVVSSLSSYRQLNLSSMTSRWPYRRILSACLQLAIFAVILLALSDPAPSRRGKVESIVVVIDTSLSMMEKQEARTRLALAKQAATRYIESLEPHTRVWLASADSQLLTRVPWTSDRRQLETALEHLVAHPRPFDVGAWETELVALLETQGASRWHLFTSPAGAARAAALTRLGAGRVPGHSSIVGSASNQVAITGLWCRRREAEPSLTEVRVQVQNAGVRAVTVGLDLFADDYLASTVELSLASGEQKSHLLEITLPLAPRLHAALRPLPPEVDALTLDNHAYVVAPNVRATDVLVLGRDNLYLEAALLADPALHPTFLSPDEAAVLPSRSQPSALVVDGGPLPRPLRAPTLWLNPSDSSAEPIRTTQLRDFGFDTWDHDHPALKGLDLFDVQVSRGKSIELASTPRVLGRAGTSPILVETKRDGNTLLVLGFDPKDSDLVLRPIFPLFVAQAIAYLQGRLDVAPARGVVDRAITVKLTPRELEGGTIVQVRAPNGTVTTLLPVAAQVTWVPEQPGFYELYFPGSPHPARWFAVNVRDGVESISTLTGREERTPAPSFAANTRGAASAPIGLPEEPERRQPWAYYLMGLAWLLLLLEWPSFHRRVTT